MSATPLSAPGAPMKTRPSPTGHTGLGGVWSASQPPDPLSPLNHGEFSFVTVVTLGYGVSWYFSRSPG